jgi:hypothetical protein
MNSCGGAVTRGASICEMGAPHYVRPRIWPAGQPSTQLGNIGSSSRGTACLPRSYMRSICTRGASGKLKFPSASQHILSCLITQPSSRGGRGRERRRERERASTDAGFKATAIGAPAPTNLIRLVIRIQYLSWLDRFSTKYRKSYQVERSRPRTASHLASLAIICFFLCSMSSRMHLGSSLSLSQGGQRQVTSIRWNSDPMRVQ